MQKIIDICDACKKERTQELGKSYPIENNWTRINVEGFGIFLFCPECSKPIRGTCLLVLSTHSYIFTK